MKTLKKQIKKFQEEDIEHDVFQKLEGTGHPQASVEIFWSNTEETDKGYVFVLPEQNFDEDDFCVHIPFPDNSAGIGDAPEVHSHVYNLLLNKLVKKIVVTGGIKF